MTFTESCKGNLCRNCGSHSVLRRDGGVLAPFFILRVLGLVPCSLVDHISNLLYDRGFPRIAAFSAGMLGLLRRMPGFREVLGFRGSLKLPLQVCRDCGFVGAFDAFRDEDLLNFYRDYRSDKYNEERCRVEPSYRAVMHDVGGQSRTDVSRRVKHVDEFLAGTDFSFVRAVVDVGGGSGKFLPSLMTYADVTVVDVSDEALDNPRFSRRSDIESCERCDFMQLSHVLEHVSFPQAFLRRHLEYLRPGGIVYLEVPQDQSDEYLSGFAEEGSRRRMVFHEHVNLYRLSSARRLAESCGLEVLRAEGATIDVGRTRLRIVSVLARKNPL
jgi:hypothetical protein